MPEAGTSAELFLTLVSESDQEVDNMADKGQVRSFRRVYIMETDSGLRRVKARKLITSRRDKDQWKQCVPE